MTGVGLGLGSRSPGFTAVGIGKSLQQDNQSTLTFQFTHRP